MSILISRGEFIAGLFASAALASPLSAQPSASAMEATVRTVQVPFDHRRPSDGQFALEYYIAQPFRPDWPSVFVVGDGQQFYIRRDLWAGWRDRFGPQTNVIGIAGRGFADGVHKRVGMPSGVGWVEAYRLLRYEQWIADIDAVRRSLLGADGRIRIYGVSGGGRLAHEYVAGYPHDASALFTRAAVFSYLNGEFNLQPDQFWREISDEDRRALAELLGRYPGERESYARLFQRQNFFVAPDDIANARTQLIADLTAQRSDVVAKLRQEYQIDAIDQLLAKPIGAAIRVRLFEFFAPVAKMLEADGSVFRPDLEVSRGMAGPLLEHWRAGRIPTPSIDLRPVHGAQTQAVIVAGRHDHTCDYRSQIALASHYPNRRLLIVDDDHLFKRMAAVEGLNQKLFSGWRQGMESPAFNEAVAALEPLLWREQ